VWAELEKVMKEKTPERFFHTLEETHALETIFPELKGVTSFWGIHQGTNNPERFGILALTMGMGAHRMFKRLKAPVDLTDFIFKLVLLVNWLKTNNITPQNAMWVFKTVDAFRDKEFLKKAFWTVEGFSVLNAEKIRQLAVAFVAADEVGFDQLTEEQRNRLKGPEIGQAIADLRLEAIRNI